METVDPTKASEVARSLCKNYSVEVESFSSEYSDTVEQFSELIAECYKRGDKFSAHGNKVEQEKLSVAFLDLAINNLFSSMQLLIIEHIIPSGNMYRQAIEAACLSILLSHQGKLTPNSN
ncbi:hypothetical protein MJO52_17545 [Microbulbifer variabilis]|uniref:Uncharacterized protein n=1 Tax=Microbulbifer variabilis TaxID=266805 RepID=A0ABY4V993_9GAMM|nr:hypothetical protein [Microbulbifer variabilis]USD20845.1 hypothetical protein MJO52_17545 [Microbulbifer variabilis]